MLVGCIGIVFLDILGMYLVVSSWTIFWVSGPLNEEASFRQIRWFYAGIGYFFTGIWLLAGSVIVAIRIFVTNKPNLRISDWFLSAGIAFALTALLLYS